ncbi:MAG: amidohydrolase family protein [Planctomycetota bacterium]
MKTNAPASANARPPGCSDAPETVHDVKAQHSDTAGTYYVAADGTDTANTLGLDYRALAAELPYTGPILDVHTHVGTPEAAKLFLEVADLFGVERTYTMTGLDNARRLHPEFGERIKFICVPDYMKRETPGTFTTQWLKDIESFRKEFGSKVIKFWCAPRGRDFAEMSSDSEAADAMLLDSPIRKRGMKLAYDLGYRVFMTHVGDPDTWFATDYANASRYGTKLEQFEPLEAALDEYADVTWIGAHMGGYPEDLDWLQGMLDRHPNYVVDTSACKWQIRELSKQPEKFKAFCQRNPGRVLFGTDIVANQHMNNSIGFDLFASRFWTLRTMIETLYDGPSPIVDPDLHKVDPSVPKHSTTQLRGANMEGELLKQLYYVNAKRILESADG